MMQKVLLLDIENIQKTEQQLLALLPEYACVYLVYAKSPVSISLDGLLKFSDYIQNKQLVVIKMPKIGKDSADFGLAFLAGQLSIQLNPTETTIEIMSNDKALEYIVDLLKVMRFEVIKTQTQEPEGLVTPNTSIHNKNVLNEYIQKLLPSLYKSMPKTTPALYNFIRACLKVNNIDCTKVINFLKTEKIIQIHNQMVSYKHTAVSEAVSEMYIEHQQALSDIDLEQVKKDKVLLGVKKYCDFLAKIDEKCYPAREESLFNSITNVMLKDSVLASQVFQKLKALKIIVQQNHKFTYNKALFQQWASLILSVDSVNQTKHQPIKIDEQHDDVDEEYIDNTDGLIDEEYTDDESADLIDEEYIDDESADLIDEEYIDDESADLIDEEYIDDESADLIDEDYTDDESADLIDEEYTDDESADLIDEEYIDDESADLIDEDYTDDESADLIDEENMIDDVADIVNETMIDDVGEIINHEHIEEIIDDENHIDADLEEMSDDVTQSQDLFSELTDADKNIDDEEQEYSIPKEYFNYLSIYCHHLAELDGRKRPASEAGLVQSIYSVLKLPDISQAEDLFDILQSFEIFTVNQKRVKYHTEHFSRLYLNLE